MRLVFAVLALGLASPAVASGEAELPFLAGGEQTCLASGPRREPAPMSQADEVTILRQSKPDPLSEAAAWDRLLAAKGVPVPSRSHPAWAVVKLRGETRPRLAQLGCFPAEGGGISCGVECDGGTVILRETAGGFSLRNRGLRLGGACGSSDRVWWKNGPHDTDFSLTRLDGPACGTAIESMRPSFATLGQPVLDRIAEGRSCFARRYEPGHLRAHPEQRVASIRMEWKGFDPEDGDRGQALFSVALRTGETASESLSCQAEGFAVQCFPKHGDGDLLLTRGRGRSIRLSTQGLEGRLDVIGGLKFGRQDDVFALDEVPCGPRTQ